MTTRRQAARFWTVLIAAYLLWLLLLLFWTLR